MKVRRTPAAAKDCRATTAGSSAGNPLPASGRDEGSAHAGRGKALPRYNRRLVGRHSVAGIGPR
jgi:hypothetical protein